MELLDTTTGERLEAARRGRRRAAASHGQTQLTLAVG